jgi:pre-rRNA-processing protein IPI1
MLQIEQTFDEFNLSFCTLTSLLVKALGTSSPSPLAQRKRKKHRQPLHFRQGKTSTSIQTKNVMEYIIRRLGGEAKGGIAVPITHTAYVALLPSIWSLIGSTTAPDEEPGPDKLLDALLDHALKIPFKSPCKRASVEFVGRLFLVSWVAGDMHRGYQSPL